MEQHSYKRHPQATHPSEGLPCAFHVARIHLASLATSVKGTSGRTDASASGTHPMTVGSFRVLLLRTRVVSYVVV